MMTENPLVSAIIPVYNRPDHIVEAVRSVLDQTWRPLELIVGDDGSDDMTHTAVASLTEEANMKGIRLKLLDLEHVGCPGAVRNSCAAEAEGRYLAFLDSDDLWLPEKIARQMTLFLEDEACLIAHTREEWNRKGRVVSQAGMKHRRSGDLFTDALKKCIIGPSTVMIRRDYYLESGGFRADLEIAEDYEYWLRVTAEHPVAYLEEPLTVKRAGHNDQLSEKYGQIEIFRIRGLKDLVDRTFFQGWKQESAARELSRKCLVYGRGCMKRDKAEEGQVYLDQAGFYEVLADNLKEKE